MGGIPQAEVLAEVRAAGVTTRYRRAGTGPALLLLCDASDPRFAPLLEALAPSHRVIAPVCGPDDDVACSLLDRLTSFLDGLGLATALVVGVGRSAGPAAALARLHADRVEALVLVGEPDGDPAAHVALVRGALARQGSQRAD